MRNSLLIILISSINFLSSQDTRCGAEIHNRAIKLYYAEKYKEALLEIEKTTNCNSYYYKYDAACIAAKLGDKEKAFSYLQSSIKLGWANMRHLKDDNDLESLKTDERWKSLDSLKKETSEKIISKIESVNKKCSNQTLVPYLENGKWGYLNKKSRLKETDAIFNKAGFLNPQTVIEYGQYFVNISCENGITRILEDPLFSEEYYEDKYKIDSTLQAGFRVENIKYRTKEYHYSSRYAKFKGHSIKDDFIGIVQNEDSFSIINSKGEVINKIEKLKKIKFHNYGTDSRSDLNPVNDLNDDFILFFVDPNDNLGYIDNNFNRTLLTNNADLTLPYMYSFKSSKEPKKVLNYIFIKRKNKVGVWDSAKKDWVIKPKFDNVTEAYNLKDSDNEDLYFLVELKGKTFYVDSKGKALLPKK